MNLLIIVSIMFLSKINISEHKTSRWIPSIDGVEGAMSLTQETENNQIILCVTS